MLIGADGIHSMVRGQTYSGKELPRYTGNVAWSGLMPAEPVPVARFWMLGHVTGVWMGPNRSIVQY